MYQLPIARLIHFQVVISRLVATLVRDRNPYYSFKQPVKIYLSNVSILLAVGSDDVQCEVGTSDVTVV